MNDGRNLEGSGCRLIEVLSLHIFRAIGESRGITIRIAHVLVEIQTEHLSNVKTVIATASRSV
jgi:hypothetical protein